jgi:hypothetical protein
VDLLAVWDYEDEFLRWVERIGEHVIGIRVYSDLKASFCESSGI